ncbi:general secretion pathway protein GspB [Thalassotalea eurytherma]|uniref:Type II secretion system protein GspB C-terminal domain-containing protein n=1 Tax=Thalassotalea eurytherma TaxID=1144278 RepID=A0ABQ6H2X8_9GAMM|nr:general secretion pathway protein GspB [Thalassotalea eurytherma]GLX82530.1 hypothetical protein theurythT_19820 [Thalassotalea eurytherma]
MSYILDALKKQQGESKQPVNSPLQQATSHIHQSPNMLLWGILLTCAIFLALLAGFWMGAQSNAAADKRHEPVIGQPTSELASAAQPSLTGPSARKVTDVDLTNKVAVSSSKRIPAEQFFQSPPSKKIESKPIVEPVEDSNTKPLILGANTDSVTADGELITTSSNQNTTSESVSASLLAKFEAAVNDTPAFSDSFDDESAQLAPIEDISQLPIATQNAIAPFSFAMHIYQSNSQGWVKVAEQDYYEGEQLPNGVVIEKIEPQQVILRFNDYQFSMAALSSWQ